MVLLQSCVLKLEPESNRIHSAYSQFFASSPQCEKVGWGGVCLEAQSTMDQMRIDESSRAGDGEDWINTTECVHHKVRSGRGENLERGPCIHWCCHS